MIQWDINGIYPLVHVYKKLLKMAIEIVDFPIKNGEFFYGKMLVHQRVPLRSTKMAKLGMVYAFEFAT